MLYLTRKQSESIIIGDEITITNNRIDSSQVSIGIDAPVDISVHREEVYLDLIEAEAVD